MYWMFTCNTCTWYENQELEGSSISVRWVHSMVAILLGSQKQNGDI